MKKLSLILLLSGVILTFVLFLLRKYSGEVTQIPRPEGAGSIEKMLTVLSEEGTEDIRIRVLPRRKTREEAENYLTEVYTGMQRNWLGKNSSADEITDDLSLYSALPEGVYAEFESDAPDILTHHGILSEQEDGKHIHLTVRLGYEGYAKEFIWELQTKVPQKKEALSEYLLGAEEADRSSSVFLLPSEWNGSALHYRMKTGSPFPVLLGTVLISLILYFLPHEKEKEREQRKQERMRADYPAVLLKLCLYVQGGYSIREAFRRSAADGAECKTKYNREENLHPVYREMKDVMNRMEAGLPETEAYLLFGERIGLPEYRRLANFLSESVEQGLSGMAERLENEMNDAYERYRTEMLKKNEVAAAKLVYPMVFLLFLVILVLMVPAFMQAG